MKASIRFCLGAALCTAILFIATFSFLPIVVQADTDAEKAVKKAEAETAKAEKAATEAGKAKKAADEAAKKAGTDPMPEDQAADDAAKAADAAAEAADEAQDKAQKEQAEADDAAKDAKNAGGKNEEKNKKAADEKKEADDAAAAAKTAEEAASAKEKEADEADKKADAADKNMDPDLKKKKADARLKRKQARAARRAAAKAIREAEKLLHDATSVGKGSESKTRKKRLDDLAERLKGLKKLEEDARKSEEPPIHRNFIPPSADQPSQPKTANGLSTVAFDTVNGKVIAYLPDDMMAGDTISGTVIAEPKGNTQEERAKNQGELSGYVIAISNKDPKATSKAPPVAIFDLAKSEARPNAPLRTSQTFTAPEQMDLRLFLIPNENSPTGAGGRETALKCMINESCSPISQLVFAVPTHPSGAITSAPKTDAFVIPPLGQTGKPLVILGPFDGDSANTKVNWMPRTPVQDFEKNTENVSGGFALLAESRGKAVFTSPTTVTGPIDLRLTEGQKQTSGSFRNVGVNLSAPKTTLLRGEKTTLTVQVSGLEGLKEPVPMTLDCTGVITMEGGTSQPLVIQPSQVGADGRYTMTRGITGVQTGDWTAIAATVKSKDELFEELEVLRRNKKYDCDHGREYQQAMAERIAAIKRALRGFHHQTVLNDPIDENCPPK